LSIHEARLALGPTLGALSAGVKWPGHEAENLSPSTAKVKNEWRYTSFPPYVFIMWCLVKYRICLLLGAESHVD
jgi:hypothetical protein